MTRKKRNAAFSLFSFQDIITAVTAILILILLIMTLSLIRQKENRAASSGSTARNAIRKLASDLLRERNRLLEETQKLKQNKSIQRSRNELESEITSKREKLNQLQSEYDAVEKIKRVNKRIENQLQKKINSLTEQFDQLKLIKSETDDLKKQVIDIKQRNLLERERQKNQKDRALIEGRPIGDILTFNTSNKNGLQPWLLNINSDGLTAHQIGTKNPISLGNDAKSKEFGRWLSSRDRTRDHCLILVRPSGITSLPAIRERLEIAGIPFGIDLVAEDAFVRDSEAEQKSQEAGDS